MKAKVEVGGLLKKALSMACSAQQAVDIMASGTSGTCTWVINSAGTLTVSPAVAPADATSSCSSPRSWTSRGRGGASRR